MILLGGGESEKREDIKIPDSRMTLLIRVNKDTLRVLNIFYFLFLKILHSRMTLLIRVIFVKKNNLNR